MSLIPRLLIVDDDLEFGQTLSDILQAKGYPLAVATDGYEAIQQMKESSFTFILLDLMMPEMNGLDTYREIKKVHPETPVVIMTAYPLHDLVQEALDEGAYGVVYKPLSIEEVIGLIARAASGGPS